jgi:hypothetical protein
MATVTRFENRKDPIIPARRFAARLARAMLLWCGLAGIGMAIGITGYATTEGMSFVDAFVNATMILSGMGPVTELKTVGGKLFAGFYALFSGLFVVVATGIILAPVLHRVLHSFHGDEGRRNDD